MTYQEIHNFLLEHAGSCSKHSVLWYKTKPGQYAEHDRFLGIRAATIQACAQKFESINLQALHQLIQSSFNEERSVALQIAIRRYRKGSGVEKEAIYQWYLDHIKQVNNWNLVDVSAHYILGAHLFSAKKDLIFEMARSPVLWNRRIAIVSTWYDIRHGCFETTLAVAAILLNDSHDLIHKAVGWMLREVGKRDKNSLYTFLDEHVHSMPRTMLRYAIEKFPQEERKKYMHPKQRLGFKT